MRKKGECKVPSVSVTVSHTLHTHAPRVREGCSRTYDSGIVPFTLSVPVVTLLSGEGRTCVDGRTSV